jgi:hypothetical protein
MRSKSISGYIFSDVRALVWWRAVVSYRQRIMLEEVGRRLLGAWSRLSVLASLVGPGRGQREEGIQCNHEGPPFRYLKCLFTPLAFRRVLAP